MEQTNPLPTVKEPCCFCAKKPHLTILCAVLLVFLSFLVTYIIVKPQLTNSALLNPSSPTAKTTPPPAGSQTKDQTTIGSSAISPVASEMTDWKTYVNTIYKFSFKYPDIWRYIEKYNEQVGGIYFGDTEVVDNAHYKIYLGFDNKDYSTLKSTFNTPSDNSVVTNVDGEEGLTHSVVSLVFKEGYRRPSSFTGDVLPPEAYEPKVTAYEALVPLGEKTLRIYSFLETKEIVDQILSTFKFLD